jgi:hypothetical protein
MSKARLIITSVILEGRSQADVARYNNVSKSWVSKLITRYNNEGSPAFEPRSRKPHTTPTKTPPDVIELILELRKHLTTAGLDAGPDTITWHLTTHHRITVHTAAALASMVMAELLVLGSMRFSFGCATDVVEQLYHAYRRNATRVV